MVAELPAQPTAFVGRTNELAELIRLFDNPNCRLISLVGQGGIGKTRIALEVGRLLQSTTSDAHAANASSFHAGAVYFVPLQPLNSPEFILQAVAEAVGLQFYAGDDPQEQIYDYLRPKSALLILDNFEHLLAGAEAISALLCNVPSVRLLVTSRETLNLQEEWIYTVRGMQFPEQDDVSDPDVYSAVQLFMQSALRVRPDFTLTVEKANVLHICRLVEGMPLALEMTAAWLRRLPIQDIVRQLESGLDILESPARNIPERHRSIRTVFEHSWNQLSAAEQDVFRRLAVFRGGFRQEAATKVAKADFMVLAGLVDKSLLSINPDGRYGIHELIRQYAEEKLCSEPGCYEDTRAAHCTYYMDFLTERQDAMVRHMSLPVVNEIATELKNIRAALDWALDHDRIESYELALYCLTMFYQFRCLYEEGEEVSKRVLSKLPPDQLSEMLAHMLTMQGWFVELRTQDYARAISLMQRAVEIGTHLDYMVQMDAILRLSDIAVQQGNYEEARRLGQQCLDFVVTTKEPWAHTFGLAHQGYVLFLLGEHAEARRLILEAVHLAEQFEVTSGLSDANNNLGQVELALGAYEAAERIYANNLAYSREAGYLKGTVLALIGSGETAVANANYAKARQFLHDGLQLTMQTNQIPYVLQALTVTAELLVQMGHPEKATEVAMLVLDQRAGTHETKRRASQLLASVQPRLSATSLAQVTERARCCQIDQTVYSLIESELSDVPTSVSPVPEQGTPGPLTERETEILGLVSDGLSNREIADRLNLTVGTVKWYLSEIYSKLYVSSRTQAIARAKELHILS